MVLLLIFSQILYFSISANIKNNVEGNFTNKLQQDAFVSKQISDLQTTLLLTNAGIIVIIGGLSFFLAGKTLNPIKKTLNQQKQFLSDASHELRTPLSILQINMENVLKEKKHDSKAFKNTVNNLEEVQKMTSLVNGLLLLSRLETADYSAPSTNVNLNNLLKGIVTRFLPYAKKRKVLFESIAIPSKQITIKGNSELLSQAFGNVIKNAVDYNRREKGKVSVLLEEKSGFAIIKITDTGLGISKKHLPFVFNRFYKGEESRSEHKGSGLGLSIAGDIIIKHKGEIYIEQSSSKGTVVHISLPLSKTS